MTNSDNKSILRRASVGLDGVVAVISPKAAHSRAAHRMAYDAIDGGRTRKKRNRKTGTGDSILLEHSLGELRDIARDMSRNNPIAKGMLKIERDGVIGAGIVLQAKTGDDNLNDELEAAWKEKMLDVPCDVTGRYNFNQYTRKAYISYRRDGDFATVFSPYGIQAIEGEQIGTVYGRKDYKHLDVVNGVAFSKKTGRLVGYYIGKPNKWGYIQPDSVKKFKAAQVHHMFNAERFSYSRGEPILTASVTALDDLKDYVDAELVAAKVNACFSMFVSRKSEYGDGLPPLSTDGVSTTGFDETGKHRLEKIQPGMIMYGEQDESAQGIGMTHPGVMFEPFINKMLAIVGRPMLLPLMLITGDYSGATFMNTRVAYGQVQDAWKAEQTDVVIPFGSRCWRWFVDGVIASGEIKTNIDEKKLYGHEVRCRRWPYVDPFKEAKADEFQLKNGTTSRTQICARQGTDFKDVTEQNGKDKTLLKENGLNTEVGKQPAQTNKTEKPKGDDDAK